MNRFYSIPFKTLAVLLSYVLCVLIIVGCIGVFLFFEMGVYTKSATEVYNDLAGYLIRNDAQGILLNEYYMNEHPDYYRYGVRFEVQDLSGQLIYSDLNYHGYELSYMVEIGANYWVDYEAYPESEVESNPVLKMYINNAQDAQLVEGVTYGDGYYREGYYEVRTGYPANDVIVTAYLLTGENWGEYNLICRGIPAAFALRFWIIPIIIISAIGFIVLMVYLMCASGRRKNEEGVHKRSIDRVPFDIYTAVMVGIGILFVLMLDSVGFGDVITVLLAAALGSLSYFLLLAYFMSLAVRLKCGDIIKKTLIYMVIAFVFKWIGKLFKMLGYIFKRLPLVWRSALIIFAVAVYNLIVALIYDPGYGIVLWLIEAVVLIPVAVLAVIALRKIQHGGREISRGNLDYQIDTMYMTGSLKEFSEDLNSIGEGLSKAVDERMKSERFKTELITNVSHDIKTPLTSIINYVDLIKKEQPESENMRQYVDVLDRQSSRLKKLIEDLVEASKASTGNVSVNMEKCEVAVILAQMAGEYDEKLKKNELELVMNIPEAPCTILADGRHLWRVLDNLMNNICKYAQPQTRVYINLESAGDKVSIVFRNVSKYALNLTSEEFLERFTRGDSSRSTEGSGLGLSIANSLTEVQGGSMTLTVDGDLFKVTLTFDAI